MTWPWLGLSGRRDQERRGAARHVEEARNGLGRPGLSGWTGPGRLGASNRARGGVGRRGRARRREAARSGVVRLGPSSWPGPVWGGPGTAWQVEVVRPGRGRLGWSLCGSARTGKASRRGSAGCGTSARGLVTAWHVGLARRDGGEACRNGPGLGRAWLVGSACRRGGGRTCRGGIGGDGLVGAARKGQASRNGPGLGRGGAGRARQGLTSR